MIEPDQVKWHKKRYQQLEQNRANFNTLFQDIAEVTYPTHANFTYQSSPGEKRMQKVFDPVAIHSNELLASGLFSLLTSPASKWFQLMPVDLRDYDIKSIKEYLDIISRIMFHEIHRPSAGFSTALHEFYLSYGAFGNGTIFVDENVSKQSLLFNCFPLYETYFVQDQYNIVSTLYRNYTRTVEQLLEKFGEEADLGDTVAKYRDDGKLDEKIPCCHVIMPRKMYNIVSPKPADMPFASLYINLKDEVLMKEGGFNEMPHMSARFYKESFETYGRGPGATALPDTRMIQRVKQVTIRAAQKSTDPALMLPDEGFLKPLRTIPGGLNYYRKSRIRSLRDEIGVVPSGNPEFGDKYLEQLQNQIRQIFFVDQLQLHEGPQMTATEVLQRTEEKLRLMGPLLGRIQLELLGPMIFRVHGLLARAGKFPPSPPELEGKQIKVVYTSPIARAQEQTEANGLMRVFSVLEPLLQLDPTIFDHFNTDTMVPGVFDMFSVNPKFLNDKRKVDAIRADRRKQQEAAQQAENLAKIGQGAAGVSKARATAQEAGLDTGFGMLQ